MQIKKTLVRLTAALLTVSALATPALAATGTVSTSGDVLRVREAGSTSGKVLTNLSNGTQVEVLGVTENGWYQVSVDDIQGFVSGDYLKVADAASLPTVRDPFYVKVTASSLNVRKGPSAGSDKVSSLSNGQIVKVLEETADGWYRIESGYISAEYTKEVDASEVAASSTKGQEVANYALQFLGCRYVHGGNGPTSFDCSGLTSYVYKHFGVTLNRTTSGQLDNGTPVSRDQLQPGDILIFKKGNTSARATHVGLYIGNGQFIHASTPATGVKISNLTDAYYSTGLVGCRRIFN